MSTEEGKRGVPMSARDVRIGMRVYYHGKPGTVWSAGPTAGTWWLVVDGAWVEAKTSEIVSERQGRRK